jgi:hypothetical protein
MSSDESKDAMVLKGTTLRVYRYILKSKNPVGIHDVQRGLGLSSSSVAQYHVRKLLSLGLIREDGNGYVIDKIIFANVIRFRRTAIPSQAALVAFFAGSLTVMLTVLRPATPTSTYLYALVAISIGLLAAMYETARTLSRL